MEYFYDDCMLLINQDRLNRKYDIESGAQRQALQGQEGIYNNITWPENDFVFCIIQHM